MRIGLQLSVFLLLACMFAAGCGKTPGDQQAAGGADIPRGPVFDFFDGRHPLPPSEWAGVETPAGEDRTHLITSLKLNEIRTLCNKAWMLDVLPTSKDPEFDPTGYYLSDLWHLIEIGRSGSLGLKWFYCDLNPPYRDEFRLPSGTAVEGLRIATYFLAMNQITEEGVFDELQSEHNLAETLLWIGYHFYRSEDHGGSGTSRYLALVGSWKSAFQLLARQAEANGDEVLAQQWGERLTQLEEASLAMSRAARAEINRLFGE